MRSYRHTEYALRALDIAAMDAVLLDEARAERDANYPAHVPGAAPCCECGIVHVGACDSHAVQVALVLAGVQR